jgi:hypothetical protein
MLRCPMVISLLKFDFANLCLENAHFGFPLFPLHSLKWRVKVRLSYDVANN